MKHHRLNPGLDGIQNCAGHALKKPHAWEPKPGNSWRDVLEEEGYECKAGVNAKDCEKHCGECKNFVMVYITKAKEGEEVETDDPLDLDASNFGPDTPVDYHFMQGVPGGFTEQENACVIANYNPLPFIPTDENPESIEKNKTYEKYCCCKKK
jgi:hypothetical protein